MAEIEIEWSQCTSTISTLATDPASTSRFRSPWFVDHQFWRCARLDVSPPDIRLGQMCFLTAPGLEGRGVAHCVAHNAHYLRVQGWVAVRGVLALTNEPVPFSRISTAIRRQTLLLVTSALPRRPTFRAGPQGA